MTIELVSKFFVKNPELNTEECDSRFVYCLHDFLKDDGKIILRSLWIKEYNYPNQETVRKNLGECVTYLNPAIPPKGFFPTGEMENCESLSNPNSKLSYREGRFDYLTKIQNKQNPSIIRGNWYPGGIIIWLSDPENKSSSFSWPVGRIELDPIYEKIFSHKFKAS